MANFPGSVYAPSAVSNGQTIDASRDNGQDAEITAIEQGYLQGSAPLNSSNSTVANLSVAGGSTLGNAVASSLTVSAGSSFAVRPVMPPPDMVKVYATSTQAFGSSGVSTLAWHHQEFATNSSLHSTSLNPERITPQTTGIYRAVVNLEFANASTFVRAVSINDSSNLPIAIVRYTNSTAALAINLTGYKRFDVTGGYLTVGIGLDPASTNSLSTGTTKSWFVLEKC